MARGKVKWYRDGELVELIAGGEHTYAEIGRRVGLSEAHVARIARGTRRPRLQVKIRQARQARIDLAQLLAAKWLWLLVKRHIGVGLASEDDTARRCREFVMDLFPFCEGRPRKGGKRE